MPDRPGSFGGKTVWVTGAARGIGHAIASRFAESGGQVIGFDKAFAEATAPYPFQCMEIDLAQGGEVEEACETLFAKGLAADILISAAGVLHMGAIDQLPPGRWQDMFDVNVSAVFHLLRASIPQFQEKRAGSVVAVASNAAHVPRVEMAGYAASKAALVSLVRCAGLELAAFGVRCNIVSPGSTDTAMQRMLWADESGEAATIAGFPGQFKLGIPLGRIARPEDIAEAVAFMASEQARHITMQDIVVDGGATLGA